MNTRHTEIRAQQRGIPPFIGALLDEFGDEKPDGNGAVIVFFSKSSIRLMERKLGSRVVARLAEWLDAYKVETFDGLTITIGHRHKPIPRN